MNFSHACCVKNGMNIRGVIPLAGMMIILPFAASAKRLISGNPSVAVGCWPEVNTRSIFRLIISSSASIGCCTISKALWTLCSSVWQARQERSFVPCQRDYLFVRMPNTVPSAPSYFCLNNIPASSPRIHHPNNRNLHPWTDHHLKPDVKPPSRCSIIPALGVVPSADRSPHNSTRAAPPTCAQGRIRGNRYRFLTGGYSWDFG